MIQKFTKCQLRIAVLCLVSFVLTNKSYALIPPTILVQPLGISVQNGGTAVFTVVAESILPPIKSFTWQLNGKSISPNTNVTVFNGTTNLLVGGVLKTLVPLSILTVKNVNSTNNGENFSVQISNGSSSVTSDSATLVVLLNTVSNVLNILSTGTGMTANGFKLQLSGPSGSNVVIQASADMKNWIPISTNTVSGGGVSYTDTSAKTNTFRFYRAFVQ